MAVYLSPSALSLFKSCPACFWMDRRAKLKRPRGLFPSLPSGIDRVVKTNYDWHRERGILPPPLVGKVEGKLFDNVIRLNQWRNWQTTELRYIDKRSGAIVTGAVDDALVETPDRLAPLDYKTHGTPWDRNPSVYYQDQLNLYSLLFYTLGFPVAERGWIVCYSPQELSVHSGDLLSFPAQVFEMPVSPKAAQDLVRAAAACAHQNRLPASSPECEYCSFAEQRYVQQRMDQQRATAAVAIEALPTPPTERS